MGFAPPKKNLGVEVDGRIEGNVAGLSRHHLQNDGKGGIIPG
jgi:hypothetical protein